MMFLLIDMRKALDLWRGPHSDSKPPDFSARCQPNPTNSMKHNSHCKQADTTMLEESSSLNLSFEP